MYKIFVEIQKKLKFLNQSQISAKYKKQNIQKTFL